MVSSGRKPGRLGDIHDMAEKGTERSQQNRTVAMETGEFQFPFPTSQEEPRDGNVAGDSL